MFKKIIGKILYSKYIMKFFYNDNFISNYLLSLVPLFQRKFIKISTSNKNDGDNKFEKTSIKALNNSGEKFKFINGIDETINLKEMNSVAGYVPYQKNCTQILLYNFFSKNYSIRKQLLGTFYLLKDSKKVYQKWFLLPVDCVKFLDLKDLEDLNGDADNIVVELFHQKLPNNHGFHDGHLRFHGIYDNLSTAHSSPIKNIYFKKNNVVSTRRYFPKWIKKNEKEYYIKINNIFESSKIYNVNKNKMHGDYSQKSYSPLGYNLILEKNKINKENFSVNSIFHDAQFNNFNHQPEFEIQIIYIPPVKNIDATLYFTDVIIEDNIKSKFNFFYKELDKQKKTFEVEIKKNDEINLLDLHEESLDQVDFIIVELASSKNKTNLKNYINIHYSIDKKLVDNVHSVCLEDDRCLGYKKNINNGPQGLKWMHFPSQEQYNSYLVLANSDKNLDFKIRVLFEDFEEKVIMYSKKYRSETRKIGVISINLKNLFTENLININKRGIIQLECKNHNIAGNLFTYGKLNNSLSVDHLTGG